MAIERNAGGFGKYIREDGEYVVRVKEIKAGLSKSQKPMLTVVFQSHDEKEIAAYFVKELAFHMKALEYLKIACGLKVTDAADQLIGKECGILVAMGEPDEKGRSFASIEGYGPAAAATNPPKPAVATSDAAIPF